jgi:hypothetical protein
VNAAKAAKADNDQRLIYVSVRPAPLHAALFVFLWTELHIMSYCYYRFPPTAVGDGQSQGVSSLYAQ